MKAKYIDKTFPITLQDLNDLAKSQNLDPHDLKLIMNSNQADLSSYVQCALLNQDCDNISIELYTEANDGLHEDIQLKTKQKLKPCSSDPNNQNLPEKAYNILDQIRYLTTNLRIQVVNDADITLLTRALYTIKDFYQKQTSV